MAQGIGNYKDYLKTRHWKSVKASFYKSRPYRCYFCGVRKGLQLHHIRYTNIGNEQLEDLTYLCSPCHKKVTFCDKDEKLKNWLEKHHQKPTRKSYAKLKKRFKKRWIRSVKGIRAKSGFNMRKNYAGIFTWKAEQVKNEAIWTPKH